jgi:HSP90 family molecular chaperone
MVNHKAFDKHTTVNKKSYFSTNISNIKPAPNAMKIYNEFKQDQHDTFYYTHNKNQVANQMPIVDL